MGRVAIETHGCKLNQADSAALAEQFAAAGYAPAQSHAEADIIVVNSCTVTAAADAKARQALRAARRANPQAVVVAAGCYPERAAAELRRMPEVSLVMGNRDKPELVAQSLRALAEAAVSEAAPSAASSVSVSWAGLAAAGAAAAGLAAAVPVGAVLRRSRAMVKIQEGCNQVCAYCIVPKVRGRERSIPPDALVAAVRRYADAGFKEVVLTGTQLGTYGFDLPGTDLPGLLDRILAETDLPRLRVSSLQAHEISGELLRRWGDTRMCPHFHIPLQSGCDRTLEAMRRRYDTAGFRRALGLVRNAVDGAAITTDVIAGFPGESRAEHMASTRLVAEMGFADIHIFPYSQRPGTSAHYYTGQIEAAEKKRRAAELAVIRDDAATRFRQGLAGAQRRVLWEAARPDDGGRLQWRGLTEDYIRVVTTTDADLSGSITPVELSGPERGVMSARIIG